jgi:hypothetical protein
MTRTVSWYTQAILPGEFHNGVFVHVEEALRALDLVEGPDEETRIIRRRNTNILIIYFNLWDGRIMSS